MSQWILHIDTASNRGLVMLSQEGRPVLSRVNENAFDHAAFVQPAIEDILHESGINSSNITCIAVANGPGSYTGLRVGLASAKGLCYAWQKPLITISNLRIMAVAMQQKIAQKSPAEDRFACFVPMIDARRMEVFFGVYQSPTLVPLVEPSAALIDEDFLMEYLSKYRIYFSGNGADKWKTICSSANASFEDLPVTDIAFAQQACIMAKNNDWTSLAYSEPFYIKEFYTPGKQGK